MYRIIIGVESNWFHILEYAIKVVLLDIYKRKPITFGLETVGLKFENVVCLFRANN